MILALALALSGVEGLALAPQEGSPDALARVLRALREKAGRSVVAIEVSRESDPDGSGGPGVKAEHKDYYNRPKGPTSGVIYEPDGHILTSHFNVSGVIRPNGIKVTFADGTQLPAELRGFDEQRDIALLKVDAKDLPVLPRADFAALGQGEFVALVGRSPDREVPTVNVGILSALSRMEKTAVQTDAEMNYGNAGGALVTLRGELVGVACQIRPDAAWGQSGGVGFACKVSEIEKVLERLKKGEKIAAEKRPYLGVRPGEGDPKVEGLQVAQVMPKSPAEKAGIQANDVLVELGGKKLTDFESLREALSAAKIGDEVVIKARRKKGDAYEDKEFKVKLEGAPER